MKAFRQFNLKFEKRLVISYATILSLFVCLIMLSPVFGQDITSNSLVKKISLDAMQLNGESNKLKLNYSNQENRSVYESDESNALLKEDIFDYDNFSLPIKKIGTFADVKNQEFVEQIKQDPQLMHQYLQLLKKINQLEIERQKFLTLYFNRNRE